MSPQIELHRESISDIVVSSVREALKLSLKPLMNRTQEDPSLSKEGLETTNPRLFCFIPMSKGLAEEVKFLLLLPLSNPIPHRVLIRNTLESDFNRAPASVLLEDLGDNIRGGALSFEEVQNVDISRDDVFSACEDDVEVIPLLLLCSFAQTGEIHSCVGDEVLGLGLVILKPFLSENHILAPRWEVQI